MQTFSISVIKVYKVCSIMDHLLLLVTTVKDNAKSKILVLNMPIMVKLILKDFIGKSH